MFCAFLIFSFVSFSCYCLPPMFHSHVSLICHQCYLSSYLCHYMKYFPFSIWATWVCHIPFRLITWHGIDPQLQAFPTSCRDSSSGTDHIWLLPCILKEKFPKSLCGKCDSILCNSLSRGISRRAPYKNDFLVLLRYKTKHECNVFL